MNIIITIAAHCAIAFSNIPPLMLAIMITKQTRGRNISDVGVPMYSNSMQATIYGFLTLTVLSGLILYLAGRLFNRSISSLFLTASLSYVMVAALFFMYFAF